MVETAKVTPPHRPTYNVRLSEEQIRSITALVLPTDDLISFEQLESGKSFNNRIYFIETRPKVTHVEVGQRSLVLKLSGHYFDAKKIQNEIGSLLLVSKYCPSVPVPKILAWSETGSVIHTAGGTTFDVNRDESDAFSKYGWILTTRMPGRVVSSVDLDGPHGESLMKEIAGHLASWRNSIPSLPGIGCIRFVKPSEQPDPTLVFEVSTNTDPNATNTSPTISLTVGGLILCHRYDPAPLPTPLSYFTYLLEDQLFQLRRLPQLKPLCARIVSRVESLVNDLPRLSFFKSSPTQPQHYNTAKLTHCDFAPRNILISDIQTTTTTTLDTPTTPHVTGILDFEFAGFCPSVDEFLTMSVRQPDDWTPTQHETLTKELARLGCDVPHLPNQHTDPVCTKTSTSKETCVCDDRAFEGLGVLVRLIGNVAPWYIQEGSHSEEELKSDIEKAAVEVEGEIEKLTEFIV